MKGHSMLASWKFDKNVNLQEIELIIIYKFELVPLRSWFGIKENWNGRKGFIISEVAKIWQFAKAKLSKL